MSSLATASARLGLRRGPQRSVALRHACSAAAASSAPATPGPSVIPRDLPDGPWSAADRSLVQHVLSGDGLAEKPNEVRSLAPKALLGSSLSELEELFVTELGQKKFRAKQVHDLMYKQRIQTWDDASTLPKALRAQLDAANLNIGRNPIHHIEQAPDGTAKLLIRLHDGYVVETVGIPELNDGSRLTVCVSSQVGCPMRCTFCATGKGGFARNLTASEIVDQVLAVEDHFGRRVTNLVYMGMGEPLLNLRGVLASHRCLHEDIGLSARGMTISTVGVPNAIARLAERRLQSTLAISLHAPNQRLREEIVPSAKAYPLPSLLADAAAYVKETKRRITFEYVLLEGVNDQVEHAKELADRLKRSVGRGQHVNLIPFNPVDDSGFQRPARNQVFRFANALTDAGCTNSIRITRGLEASAACGQLRNQFQSKKGPRAS
mmetsp:Transcript_9043/g.29702  ORF Transcript_9043/g.29702 Transcript_9043/m.29702 type:complete len:435 (-) Transcript_9043:629-1933(-)